jgi:hypothetical protein
VSPIDVAWNRQWRGAQDWIHSLVGEKNRILRKRRKPVHLQSYLIDAFSRQEIEDFSRTDKKFYVISEHTIENVADNVTVFQLPSSLYGMYHSEHQVDTAITKDFNCFLNRIDPIRQTWFYLLYSNTLLQRGHVSFNMEVRQKLDYPETSSKDIFDRYHELYLSSFHSIKPQLDKIVPYKSFDPQIDLFTLSAQSKFGIIVETYFERTDAKVLSEKTFRALQTPRPWMLFAATGCVQKLRDMGFEVFDDVIDHSYNEIDTSENASPVIDKIIEQAKSLVDLEMTPSLNDRLWQGCQHNKKILAKWKQNWQEDILSVIDSAFEQALLK